MLCNSDYVAPVHSRSGFTCMIEDFRCGLFWSTHGAWTSVKMLSAVEWARYRHGKLRQYRWQLAHSTGCSDHLHKSSIFFMVEEASHFCLPDPT